MRRHSKIIAMTCLSLVGATTLAADERSDSAHLEQMIQRIEKSVPAGWSVSYKLANPEFPDRHGSHPTVVIQSNDPLPVQHFYPGTEPPFPGESLEIARHKVTAYFVASPYLSRDQYAEVQKQNDALLRKRSEFQKEKLKDIPWAYKGAEPIPPDAFVPQNEAEARRVREYAFLWISTQPKPLPTHFTDNLSFEIHLPGSIKIHDPKTSKEYEQTLKSVQKVIVPYEAPN